MSKAHFNLSRWALLAALLFTACQRAPVDHAPSTERDRARTVASRPSREHLLGTKIDDFTLSDTVGQHISLSDFDDRAIIVVVFLGVDCPLAQHYARRLNDLAERFMSRGVAFVGIDSNLQDGIDDLRRFAAAHELLFPLLHDVGNVVADRFEAARTPEVFVLDRQRQVRYLGRVDDEFGFRDTIAYQRPRDVTHFLVSALEEILAGGDVSTAYTESHGCLIGRARKADPDAPVTWCKDIAPIMQEKCQPCHRPNQTAPFSLLTYEDAVGWQEMILEVVEQGRMPPWHADPNYGEFFNDPRLSDAEKQRIATWVRHGGPEGDPADLPPPIKFREGWRLKSPDLIVKISEQPLVVPAAGLPDFKYFLVDLGLTEGRWVDSMECRPDNKSVVHHMDVLAAPAGDFDEAFRRGAVVRLGGFVPGVLLTASREDEPKSDDGSSREAKRYLPPGTQIVIELHYKPNGLPQTDLSEVAFQFVNDQSAQPSAPARPLVLIARPSTETGELLKSTAMAGTGTDATDQLSDEIEPSVSGGDPDDVADDKRAEPDAASPRDSHVHPASVDAPATIDELATGSSTPSRRRLFSYLLQDADFCIPAGASNHPTEAWYMFLGDAVLGSLHVHMHVRGRSMRFEAHYPDGQTETLLNVPRYDYDWQHLYQLKHPKPMPRGTRIHAIAHFDNSPNNPQNPDPTAPVVYGRGYYVEEMMAGSINFVMEGDGSVDPARLASIAAGSRRKTLTADEAATMLAGYTAIEKVSPESKAVYYYQRALYRDALGDLQGAVDDLAAARAADPKLLPAVLVRAQKFVELGRLQDAFEEYTAALELDPNHVEALLGRGRLYADRNQAWDEFQRAVAADPRCAEAIFELATIRESRGDLIGALADLERIIDEIHPGYTAAYLRRGAILIARGQEERGLADFKTVVKRWPTRRTKVDYQLGLLYFQLGRFADAAPHLEAYLRIMPDDVQTHKRLAMARIQLGLEWQAVDALAHIENLASEDAESQYLIGAAKGRAALRGPVDEPRSELLVESEAHLKRALRLRPDYADAAFLLAQLLAAQQRVEDAVREYRRAYRLAPTISHASALAWLLSTTDGHSQSDAMEAIRLAQRACQATGFRHAGQLDILAAAQAQANRFNEATATAARAVELAEAAGREQQADAIRARLALYQQERPFREQPGIDRPVDDVSLETASQ